MSNATPAKGSLETNRSCPVRIHHRRTAGSQQLCALRPVPDNAGSRADHHWSCGVRKLCRSIARRSIRNSSAPDQHCRGGDGGVVMLLMGINPIACIIICIGKGAAAGWISGLVYRLLAKKKRACGRCYRGRRLPDSEHRILVIGLLLFFNSTIQSWAGGQNMLYYVIFGLMGINFVVELLVKPRPLVGHHFRYQIRREGQELNMILAIDVGNTNIVLGMIENGEIQNVVRIHTDLRETGNGVRAQAAPSCGFLSHIDLMGLEGGYHFLGRASGHGVAAGSRWRALSAKSR